jgi:hypothetical protein
VTIYIWYPVIPDQHDLIDLIYTLLQVLEYMGGGDLLNLLIERDVFEEDFTRFYVAEVRIRGICLHE